jgi:N-acetylneuraminic acid mutarotase
MACREFPPPPTIREDGRQATSWVDNDGFLWLFGGYGYASSGLPGGLNDLWKYDISTNEWTWVDGSSSPNGLGIYGTQGVSDPANVPGGRLESAAAWVDSLNNLWFFGGQLCCNAGGYINDVWKYDQSSGEWTWMKGSTVSGASGVYGTKGIPDTANTPGGRRIYSHWKHSDGTFWLCGGQDNFQNCFNDLWRYDPVTNDWTWVNGSNVPNAIGNSGRNVYSILPAYPDQEWKNRFYWTDSCNNFWMFGGLNTNSGIYRNDLWCYNPALNLWKWVSGSSSANQFGSYGTQGVPDASNHPGARYGGVGWMGPEESIWLYGGVGFFVQ